MHDTFVRSEQLQRNLSWILQHTHVSLAQLSAIELESPLNEKNGMNNDDAENFNPAVSATTAATGRSARSDGAWVEGCTVDIRLSRLVRLNVALLRIDNHFVFCKLTTGLMLVLWHFSMLYCQ